MFLHDQSGRTRQLGYALAVALAAASPAALLAACNAPAATPPSASASASAQTIAISPPAPTSDASLPPAATAASSRALHYDLVLTRTEGSATTRTSFSLDLSDATPGSVSFGKNVSLGGGNRSDVGARVKGRLTTQGDAPRLEVDADITSVDATGRVRHTSANGAALTPLGAATTILDTADSGTQFRLTATPTASAPLEAKAAEGPNDAYVLDVAVAHTGPGAPATPVALKLALSGDKPAVARTGESVPLSVGDAGASARQDVGTRVKATGHARGASLDVDLDFEMSALEAASPAARIRKIVSRGEVVAPFDKATTAFTGEEDGHRYVVTITPHRAK